MLDQLNIEHVLFIDIETVPGVESYEDLDSGLQQLFEAKTAYQRKDQTSVMEFYDQAGIWAEFGRIVCISVGYFSYKSGHRQFRTTSFHGDEKEVLLAFANVLNTSFSKPQFLLCGHNAKEFDFPYIARRMIIHQIKIPAKLQLFGKKPWEILHLDTMELWKFGDYKHYTSLKLLTTILGIESPKDDIDGSEVKRVFYQEQNIERIIRYCERDVVAVAQVLLRFRGEDLLNETEIISV